MNQTEMVPRSDVVEIVARERAEIMAQFQDLAAQDAAFVVRARAEGSDPRASVWLDVTSEVSDDGRPTLAVQGGVEGLPDEIFPRLSKGYTVHYQAAVREPAIEGENRPELGVPSTIDAVPSEGGA
jgi:hypothetical protein